ncbi:ATP-binding protein [archaeon]|nr:ATP-binding protein [archaeon]
MSENFNKYLSISVKLVLILSIITSLHNHLWHIASTNIFLLFLTFTPQILKKYTKIKFPTSFEITLLIFVLITLSLGKLTGIIAPILFGVGVGLIGLLFLFILYSTNQIKKNYFLIILFSFSLAITFGALLEIAKYLLKLVLHHELNEGIYLFTMQNLIYVSIGAALASIIGFVYMKTHFSIIHKLIQKLKFVNKDFFKKSVSIEEIIKEIKEGENETQEFKATLRTNLYTNQPDKKIEQSVLKTIAAFLNTKGGTLYIGITDKIKILGIEADKFENEDKFFLHFTNLLKQKIGKKYLGLIESKLIPIKDRHILRVECKKSNSPVFIIEGKDELFYTRVGPQTIELKGRELIEYVNKEFTKKK